MALTVALLVTHASGEPHQPSITLTEVTLQFLGLDASFDLPDITMPLPTITAPVG